ncbi:hypothetical protein Nepgr_016635 [Nepenthes gracilis]|uniref:Late embryogenesis abundant protein LEA-2 subgroup domain-containing protein n=1 Tax=Nepenthes gracilis TaxID=150966 RepID=A0AAD3SQ28_NEPGR|nr:hypothetical protein Nepgr_016635 [Nepenthes gracilis]
MHAKTDSDLTSLPGSSPPRSPSRRPGLAYYVQSPSRDSHDGEKTTNSFHSTPAALSPMGSPPRSHSNSSLGRHSRDSSSTRFSRSTKPGSGKAGLNSGGKNGRKIKEWKDDPRFDAIEEDEGLLGEDDEDEKGLSRRWYFVGFVAAFIVLFSFFSLVLWGASRRQKPIIAMKSVNFEMFDVQAGVDYSGVATAMASLNATVKLGYRNRATFFGVHVASTPVQLFYQQLTIASGTIDDFYEKRKSERDITVQLMGSSIPLYGGGSNLASENGAPTLPVQLTLYFRVRSRAYVLGKLVKPKFYRSISCFRGHGPRQDEQSHLSQKPLHLPVK